MRIFKEEQSFRQWWIILIALACSGIPIAFTIDDLLAGETSKIAPELISAIVMLIIFSLIFKLSLHTRIDQRGIMTWWEPFHFLEKEFLWRDIKKVMVSTYKPVQEYGGWGIRGHGKTKAYNVSGNKGIQVVHSNGKFLIGTQNPEKAGMVIKRYSS